MKKKKKKGEHGPTRSRLAPLEELDKQRCEAAWEQPTLSRISRLRILTTGNRRRQ